jgi:hypothetical protein
MPLQGPIVVVAEKRAENIIQACTAAGAFPVLAANWADAPAAVASVNPSAVVLAEPDPTSGHAAEPLAREIAKAEPILPLLAIVGEYASTPIDGALPVLADDAAERLLARLSSAQRLRALHATVLRRARTLESDSNIIAELPAGDPLEDATVLVLGRGRSHPAMTVAAGERTGVMGALSVEAAASCLDAREIDGVAIGEGLAPRSVDNFLAALAEDPRFRDLPVGLVGPGSVPESMANVVRTGDPLLLIERMLPLVRFRAFEGRLKRLLQSIECKGMIDPQTGLLHADAFDRDLSRAIDDAGERGVGLSIARFAFDATLDRRRSMDAARLVSRLVRNVDFACRQEDGSILAVFTETDLRFAHVVARRLAAVLKYTMLRSVSDEGPVNPSVTLATLKPTDTMATLTARVGPVAAEQRSA